MIYSHSSRAEEFAEPAIAIIKSAFKAPTLARIWLSNSFGRYAFVGVKLSNECQINFEWLDVISHISK